MIRWQGKIELKIVSLLDKKSYVLKETLVPNDNETFTVIDLQKLKAIRKSVHISKSMVAHL